MIFCNDIMKKFEAHVITLKVITYERANLNVCLTVKP